MKASKKLLSLLLVVMLLVSAIPFQVFAKTVNSDGSIVVPVVVKVGKNTYNKSITIPADTSVTLDETYAMDPATGLVTNPSDKVFNAWYSSTATEPVTDKELDYAWLKDEAPEDYSLTLVLDPKTPPVPTTYTATLKATLDGTEVGSDSKAGITEIELTESLAKSLYTGFDASKHEFKGWANGLTGKQTLTADATFTALFETKKEVPTGYKASIYVYVNGTLNAPVYEKTGVTNITLGETLYEEIVNAKSLGNVDDFTYAYYAGTATSGTAITGSSYTLSADAVYTIVLTAKTPDPVEKEVTFIVDGKRYAVTTCVEGQKPSVPEDPYKANYTFQGWYSAENGQGTRLVSGQNWNNSMPTTYYAYFTSNLNPKYDTIRVFVKRYVGNVLKGSEELAIADNQILRGESVLNWLNSKKDEIDGLVEDKYDGVYTWNPKYFYDNDSNAKLTSQDLVTNGNKSVFIKVYAPQIKVQLYIHKDKVTASPVIKDMDGYRIGDTVTKTAVDTIVKKYYTGSKMKIDGLYTADDWAELKKGNKPTASADLTVTENGMEIHVLVTNGSATGADPSNPKTGDYVLTTAVTLMVISGMAAAAVYVVGKKRRV